MDIQFHEQSAFIEFNKTHATWPKLKIDLGDKYKQITVGATEFFPVDRSKLKGTYSAQIDNYTGHEDDKWMFRIFYDVLKGEWACGSGGLMVNRQYHLKNGDEFTVLNHDDVNSVVLYLESIENNTEKNEQDNTPSN